MNKKRIILGTLGGILLLLIIAACGAYFWFSNYYKSYFPQNTFINGVNCSGYSASEVSEILKTQTPSPEFKIIDREGNQYSLDFSLIAYDYDYSDSVKKIQRTPEIHWLSHFQQSERRDAEFVFTYSQKDAEKQIMSLPFIVDELASDRKYRILYDAENGYSIQNGLLDHLMIDNVKEAALQAISNGIDSFSIDASFYADLDPDSDSKEQMAFWDEMQQVLNCDLTYDMGAEQIVFDASFMAKFLKKDHNQMPALNEENQFILDEEAVDSFVDDLCLSYNTYKTTRKFASSRGEIVEVEGGTYGTELDGEAEKKYLKENLMSDELHDGKKDVHTPEYLHEGVVRGLDDIGPTYIEVDMGQQHLYFYIDGELYLDTDIVTGNMKRKCDTPAGTYYIYFMQRNRTLIGTNYRTFVNYWMAVNNHIGLHDAYWRKVFGGEEYLTNGSHGCVNIPKKTAGEIYEKAYVGLPVVMYY